VFPKVISRSLTIHFILLLIQNTTYPVLINNVFALTLYTFKTKVTLLYKRDTITFGKDGTSCNNIINYLNCLQKHF
jgi:hypothetical protein